MLEGNPDLAILHVSRDYQANGKTCLNYRTACPSAMVVDVGGLFIRNVIIDNGAAKGDGNARTGLQTEE